MARPNPARRTADDKSLSIFPDQLHIGDRFTDAETGDEPHEWEVMSRPVTFKKGHEVRARVQRPGQPGTSREKYWAAHEKITVQRMTASPTRPTVEPEGDGTDVEGLRRELRRLRGEVLRLEDDKRELEKRIAHFQRGRAAAGEDPEGNLDVVTSLTLIVRAMEDAAADRLRLVTPAYGVPWGRSPCR